ncbi:MAG: aldehyde dehydrogenase family protein, partial [Steroidobacteraceae bacterium]
MNDVRELMQQMGRQARAAAAQLALADSATRNRALLAAAAALRAQSAQVIAANAADMSAARTANLSAAMLDRLRLDATRVAAIARALEDIAALADPIGAVSAEWTRPNGLRMQRVRVPLGVIGIIYESRPNVTADAGAICLKAGNAVILRGGSDSDRSNAAIHACLLAGLEAAELPAACIQLVPTADRAAVGEMLGGMREYIDVLV